MFTLTIRLFGKFGIYCDNQIISGFDGRKVQELFAYLLLYRNHPHPRETLAGLLWGDCSTAQSKTYLRKALWQLQSAFAQQPASAQPELLRVEADWVQLSAKSDLWLDVSEFERTFQEVRGVAGENLDHETFQAVQRAVELYHGDLLEGWYQDWCLYERERLQGFYLAMLDKLMGYCELHNEYEAGLTHGKRILRCDSAREHTHRRMMRLYYLAGDRTAALRQYAHCAAALDEELGVAPTEYTTTLYEQLRVNQFGQADNLSAQPSMAPADPATWLPSVLGRLKQLQIALSDFQCQVQQDIQAVEQALKHQR
jgi:DNA-binding SARP family transcriptional activator